jgi:hypothetical protein
MCLCVSKKITFSFPLNVIERLNTEGVPFSKRERSAMTASYTQTFKTLLFLLVKGD